MSSKKILYIIFASAFIIKLLCGWFLNAGNGPEVFEYETIANNILNGKGFVYNFMGVEYRAFVQPFYPVFSAAVYYLTGHSQIAMLAIQCIVSSALCFIIYSIALKLAGSRQALLAAVLVAFHPGLTVYSVLKLHSLVFDVFFYLLSISLILRFIQKPDNKTAVLTGFVIGLALLSRSTILAFAIFALAYAFFVLQGIKMKIKIKYLLAVCFSAMIIYSPWVIRNYKVFNGFVFAQTSSGENLWVGNNKAASGSAILPSGKSVHTKMPQEMREDLQNLDELGQVRFYKNYFFSFIKEEPLLFTRLFIKKLYYFWWFAPQTGTLYSRPWLHTYKLYYGILFLLFIMGLLSSLRDKSHFPLILMLCAYMLSLAFLHAIVNVDTRHRWAVEPIMIIFTSIGFFNLVSYFKNSPKSLIVRRQNEDYR
jgi:4-amino-4-deoxy-L-arabinose transferase-like glycosyltransferase